MKELKQAFRHSKIIERGLLARLLTHPEERTNIALIVRREDFQEHVFGRLYAAMLLWSADETDSLATELHVMFMHVGDEEAAEALLGLAWVPYPDSYAELVWLALLIHDRARENSSLQEEAYNQRVDEDCERLEIPIQPEEVEW